MILGVGSLISPIPFNPASVMDLGLAVLATSLLFLFMFIGRRHKLDRWQGGLFVLIYTGYVFYLLQNRI